MTFWTSTVGAFFLNTAAAASDQTSIQRYSSLPTLRKAKLAFLLQIPATFFMYLIANLIGMTVFAHYAMAGCDPLRSKAIKSANQLLPYYVLDVMGYPGFTGLFVSVLFSGALSSISSAINACAAITWKDFIDPHMPRIQESRKALLTKMLSLFYGSVAVCMAFVLTKMSGHIFQISQSVLGGIGGPMTGIIFLGSLFPCANWIGGLTGMLLGCAVAIWINFGHQIYTPWVEFLPTDTTNCSLPANFTVPPMPQNPEGVFWLYRVSFKYIGMIGCLVTVIVGLAVSFCTGATKPEDVDARTVVSLPSVGCCCCVPAAHRARCNCGVDHQKDGDGLSDDEKEIDTLMENKSDPVKTRISTM